jgi:hypothetical protein
MPPQNKEQKEHFVAETDYFKLINRLYHDPLYIIKRGDKWYR